MVPKWLENTLLMVLFALIGGLVGIVGFGFAWGALGGLALLGFIIMWEMIWRAAMNWLGRTFFTKKV